MSRSDRLADGQHFGRVGLEQRDEERAREADDVQVVALDPLDQSTPVTLDRVGARAALPLAAL